MMTLDHSTTLLTGRRPDPEGVRAVAGGDEPELPSEGVGQRAHRDPLRAEGARRRRPLRRPRRHARTRLLPAVRRRRAL